MSSELQISNSKEVCNPLMLINRDHFVSSCPYISPFGNLHLFTVIGVDTNPLYAQDGVAGDAVDAKCCDSVNLQTGHRFQFS